MKPHRVLSAVALLVVALAATTNASVFARFKKKKQDNKLPETQSAPVVLNSISAANDIKPMSSKLPETQSLPTELPSVDATTLSGRRYFFAFDRNRPFFKDGVSGNPVMRGIGPVPKAKANFGKEGLIYPPIILNSITANKATKMVKDICTAETTITTAGSGSIPWGNGEGSLDQLVKNIGIGCSAFNGANSGWLAMLNNGIENERAKTTAETPKHILYLLRLMRFFIEGLMPYENPLPREFLGKLLMNDNRNGESKYPQSTKYQQAKLLLYLSNFIKPHASEPDAMWYFEWVMYALTQDEQLRDLYTFPVPVPGLQGKTFDDFLYSEVWSAWAQVNLAPGKTMKDGLSPLVPAIQATLAAMKGTPL